MGEGYVFTPVCHSVHRVSGVSRGGWVLCPGGVQEGWYVVQGVATPPPRYGQPAVGTHPYWNAFLLCNENQACALAVISRTFEKFVQKVQVVMCFN